MPPGRPSYSRRRQNSSTTCPGVAAKMPREERACSVRKRSDGKQVCLAPRQHAPISSLVRRARQRADASLWLRERAPAVQTLNAAVAKCHNLRSHRTAAQIAGLQWTSVAPSITRRRASVKAKSQLAQHQRLAEQRRDASHALDPRGVAATSYTTSYDDPP